MIDRIDHFVLTATSIDATCEFYCRVLSFTRHSPDGKPTSLAFGQQKINVHQADRTFDPKALRPTPGAADFCLVTSTPIDEFAAHLERCDVQIEKGPIARTGAMGPMMSVYFRDPDGNLVEVAQYL
ncbi:VOC family protein [Sphingomonas sp. CL5.1]|uniref:VOC family protein n=1 Tax=Sphingomonas sp. CL5.1 TaxID=2653203 RepID=UPI0015836276|nr:VOC family protein [Sphingomonas sp. CL5.1]QKS00261.1 VOC family protein [Sphingomonas sp. CL5.1]